MQGIDLKWPSTNTGARGSHVNKVTPRGTWEEEDGETSELAGEAEEWGLCWRRDEERDRWMVIILLQPHFDLIHFFLLFVGSKSCYGEIMSREILHVGPSMKVIREDIWLAHGSKEFWEKYKNSEPPELAFSPSVGLLLFLNDAVGIVSTFLPQPLDTFGA